MAGLDDLSRGELQDILRRLRILETASPLQNASIGSNGLRVYDGGVITIENGGLNVTGTATIHGVLNADGTINFTGPVTISGPMTVSGVTDITGNTTVTGDFTTNGPLHVNGTTDITGETTITGNTTVTGDFDVNGPMKTTGTLSVEGVTTLKNDLNVTNEGKITAGNATLDPSANGGGLEFGTGGGVWTDGDAVQIRGPGAHNMTLGTASWNIGFDTSVMSTQVSGNSSGLTLSGDVYMGPRSISGVTPNLYIDGSGVIKKIV